MYVVPLFKKMLVSYRYFLTVFELVPFELSLKLKFKDFLNVSVVVHEKKDINI